MSGLAMSGYVRLCPACPAISGVAISGDCCQARTLFKQGVSGAVRVNRKTQSEAQNLCQYVDPGSGRLHLAAQVKLAICSAVGTTGLSRGKWGSVDHGPMDLRPIERQPTLETILEERRPEQHGTARRGATRRSDRR